VGVAIDGSGEHGSAFEFWVWRNICTAAGEADPKRSLRSDNRHYQSSGMAAKVCIAKKDRADRLVFSGSVGS
jgi:hypothetical protein